MDDAPTAKLSYECLTICVPLLPTGEPRPPNNDGTACPSTGSSIGFDLEIVSIETLCPSHSPSAPHAVLVRW